MDIEARTKRLRESLCSDALRNILVMAREHIGDIANSTAGLMCIRKNFPQALIHVEVGERAVGVLENFPGNLQVLPRPTHQGILGKFRRIREFRSANYDLCIIFDDSNSMVRYAQWAGIPRVAGIWRGAKHEKLFDAYVPLLFDRHEVRDHHEALLQELGLDLENFRPQVFPSQEDSVWADRELAKRDSRPVLIVHPGATERARRWPANRFGSVIAALGRTWDCRVVGGGNDESLVQEVIASADGAATAIGLPPTVLALAALLGKANLYLGNDSGPMHLAGIVGTASVGIYGPTHPQYTGPYGNRHLALRPNPVDFPTPKAPAPPTDIRDISVSNVIDAIQLDICGAQNGFPEPGFSSEKAISRPK